MILFGSGWAMGGIKPETRKQKPETRNQKPETRKQKPESRNQKERRAFARSPSGFWLLVSGFKRRRAVTPAASRAYAGRGGFGASLLITACAPAASRACWPLTSKLKVALPCPGWTVTLPIWFRPQSSNVTGTERGGLT